MQKIQKTLSGVVVLSELSHIFCCGLPILFSLSGLLAGIGLIAVMPGWLDSVHAVFHAYEIPMIIASGAVLLFGWGLHTLARRIDCRNTGCSHPPCSPKKKKSDRILIVATALYSLNVVLFTFMHLPQV